jgi:hypothetical protein
VKKIRVHNQDKTYLSSCMYVLTKYRGNCGLFEKIKDTRDWQKLMEQLRRQVERQPVGSTVKCPKCRQKIYKVMDHTF